MPDWIPIISNIGCICRFIALFNTIPWMRIDWPPTKTYLNQFNLDYYSDPHQIVHSHRYLPASSTFLIKTHALVLEKLKPCSVNKSDEKKTSAPLTRSTPKFNGFSLLAHVTSLQQPLPLFSCCCAIFLTNKTKNQMDRPGLGKKKTLAKIIMNLLNRYFFKNLTWIM